MAVTLITGKVSDIHLYSKKCESLGLANHDLSLKPSRDKLGNHSDCCSGIELKSSPESDDNNGRPRPTKRKRPSLSNGLIYKKRKYHLKQRSTR